MLKVGIFGCDAYDIISNVSAEILFEGDDHAATGLKDNTHVVDTGLTSALVNGHLANTPIFQKMWKKVFAIKRFMNYDWTLKLDIDAVIIPGRLKRNLTGRPFSTIDWNPYFKNEAKGPFKAEFMWNSDKDTNDNMLHGPVELLSKGAMQLYEAGADRCEDDINVTGYGSLALGEDFYLNRCLSHLGVPHVSKNQTNLLYDKYEYGGGFASLHCGPIVVTCCPVAGSQYWNPQPVNYAVYHYYKDILSWLQCYNEAQAEDNAVVIENSSCAEAIDATAALEPATTAAPPTPWPTPATPAPWTPPAAVAGNGACHTPVQGELCYTEVQWAKTSGMVEHPDWYPGLTAASSDAAFQAIVHQHSSDKCQAPCAGTLRLFQQQPDHASVLRDGAYISGHGWFVTRSMVVGLGIIVSGAIGFAAVSRRTWLRTADKEADEREESHLPLVGTVEA